MINESLPSSPLHGHCSSADCSVFLSGSKFPPHLPRASITGGIRSCTRVGQCLFSWRRLALRPSSTPAGSYTTLPSSGPTKLSRCPVGTPATSLRTFLFSTPADSTAEPYTPSCRPRTFPAVQACGTWWPSATWPCRSGRRYC